jgi:hypothetical protein
MAKTVLKFPADFFQQGDVHLVIQKTVYLQNIAGLDDTVF